jgi:ferredoxin
VDSPHDVLGIDPDADEATVVEAYRQKVKETHPDKGGSADAFQRVQAAYAYLQQGGADGEGFDPDGPAENGWAPTPRREPEGTPVEFLNYEVVGPQGWDLGDEDLFEKAAEAGLPEESYGTFYVRDDENILEAARRAGYEWPFSCRGGACANCAIAVVSGKVEMPSNHVLREEWLERGVRLSCIATPVSDEMQVIYNVKELPGLDELHLPPQQFRG